MILILSILLNSAQASIPEFYLPWQGKVLVSVGQEYDVVFGDLNREEFVQTTDCGGTPLKSKECFRSKTDQYFYIGQIFYQIRMLTHDSTGVALAAQSVHFPEQWILVRSENSGFRLSRWEQDREIAIPFYETSGQGLTRPLRSE